MSLLKKLGTGQGFLKAGFLGFPKSGKTFTAMLLALGVRAYFKLSGPIAFFDTESGSEYIAKRIKQETGKDLIGCRSRSFDDLVGASREAEKAKASVFITDSVTHVWRDVCDSYLKKINDKRTSRGLSPRTRLEFRDWNSVKDVWNKKWTDWYLNSPMHVIICGRAGYEYNFTEDEETGKKEIQKSGVKMKTESEFGFEPSLLVEMERVQNLDEGAIRMQHQATVIGDRFGVIDAAVGLNPTFEFFKPHVALLTKGKHAPVDTEVKSDIPIDEDGWPKEKRERVILCEEIQGEILKLYPGQTTKEKGLKAGLLEEIFTTRSWTKVESLKSENLRHGLRLIREHIAKVEAQMAKAEEGA